MFLPTAIQRHRYCIYHICALHQVIPTWKRGIRFAYRVVSSAEGVHFRRSCRTAAAIPRIEVFYLSYKIITDTYVLFDGNKKKHSSEKRDVLIRVAFLKTYNNTGQFDIYLCGKFLQSVDRHHVVLLGRSEN